MQYAYDRMIQVLSSCSLIYSPVVDGHFFAILVEIHVFQKTCSNLHESSIAIV